MSYGYSLRTACGIDTVSLKTLGSDPAG